MGSSGSTSAARPLVIGTGKIGLLTGKILSKGFGATVIAYDPYPSKAAEEYGISYVDTLEERLSVSDIISLHCPLLDSTKYIINDDTLTQTKKGIIIINTSRGGLIDTYALIRALKAGHVSAVGLDVHECESNYFCADSSAKVITDDSFSLLTFCNVFMTGHQAFLTQEALENIAQTTVQNLLDGYQQVCRIDLEGGNAELKWNFSELGKNQEL